MLTGSVTFTSLPSLVTAPNGLAFNIGDDTKHYLVVYQAAAIKLGSAEDNSYVTIKSEAQWQTDVASLSFGPTGTFHLSMAWPAIGLNRFCAVGYSLNTENSAGIHLAVGVWYTITNNTTVAVSGGFCYQATNSYVISNIPNIKTWQFASAVIGTSYYTINWMGGSAFGTGNQFLSKVALTGTVVDLSTDAWVGKNCAMPFGQARYTSSGSRRYINRSSIISDPAGIGVFFYATPQDGVGYAQSKLLYCVVNPSTMSLASGQADRSSEFGIPFTDDGKNLAGVAGQATDQYCCPSITGTTGNEIIFGRSYSDSRKIIGMRRFTQDLSTGVVTSLGASTFEGTADVFAAAMDQVQFQRETGILNTVMDNQAVFHFGGLADVAPPPAGTGRRWMATPGPYRVNV